MADLSQMSDDELLAMYQELRGGNGKPMPAGVQKLETDDIDMLGAAASSNRVLQQNRARLEGGQLNLGPLANPISEVRNWAGMSDANSRNYASFRAGLEKMRNDSLRLNKGVQTEGDAIRAWNELMKNTNDEKLVAMRLAEIEEINNRAIQFRGKVINERRSQYKVAPLDTNQFTGNAFEQPKAKMGYTGRTQAADAQRARKPAPKPAQKGASGFKYLGPE